MKRLLIITALLLTACAKAPESTSPTSNHEFKVERLFTYEGCTVYRFADGGRDRYYTDCRGAALWSESCGKNCTSDVSVETSR